MRRTLVKRTDKAAGRRRRWAALSRQRRDRWGSTLSGWLRQWLPVLQQTPAARRMAEFAHSAAAEWAWERRRGLAEIALYFGAYLAYVFSRGLVYDSVREVGIINGGRIAELQRQLWFLWEPGWQAWAIEHVKPIVVFLNWTYILTYWPVILGLAISCSCATGGSTTTTARWCC